MILKVHLDGAPWYEVGDEIWQVSLEDAIRSEAELIASYATDQPPDAGALGDRETPVDRIATEMSASLTRVGDRYRSLDGILYSLLDPAELDSFPGGDKLSAVVSGAPEPIVDEVLRFEDLPLGSGGTRCAIVRWTDGSEGIALTWYGDEILICEGDLIGKTQAELRSLHFRRDRDWLQS